MKPMWKWIIGIVSVPVGLVVLVSLPAGPPVAAYKTNWQSFSWGKMYVWAGNASLEPREGKQLNWNISPKNGAAEIGCNFTVKRVYLKDPDSDVALIDEIVSPQDSDWFYTRLTSNKQIRLTMFPVDLRREDFPYDLEIDFDLDCKDGQSSYTFSEPLDFRMVQPRLSRQ